MKNSLIVISFILVTFCSNAQDYHKITYEESTKLELNFDGIEIEGLADKLPNSLNSSMELYYNGTNSFYSTQSNDQIENQSFGDENNQIQIKFVQSDTKEILHKNFANKSTLHQQDFMSKVFLIEGKMANYKWKITNEKIKYLGYECQKAVIENDDKFIVAWFTSELPSQAGPASFHGLPGTILMVSVNDGTKEIKATEVVLNAAQEDGVEKPGKGKKVNQEEFEKIQKEKMEEMSKSMKGRSIKIMGG